MEKKIKIDEFLKKLGHSSEGKFFIVCGKCGVSDEIKENYGEETNIDNEVTGTYSEYTGHLWDDVNIKCKKCGNAISFSK